MSKFLFENIYKLIPSKASRNIFLEYFMCIFYQGNAPNLKTLIADTLFIDRNLGKIAFASNVLTYLLLYLLIPGHLGRPDPLENCTIQNQTADSLYVECDEGFNGGLPQEFVMEVYDSQSQLLVSNVTTHNSVFLAAGLPSGLGFDIVVYSINSKGPSDVTHLSAHTLKSAARRTGQSKLATSAI